jgi:hypothetical protein
MSYRRKVDRLVIGGASVLSGAISIAAGSWALFWFLSFVISLAAAHFGTIPVRPRR